MLLSLIRDIIRYPEYAKAAPDANPTPANIGSTTPPRRLFFVLCFRLTRFAIFL